MIACHSASDFELCSHTKKYLDHTLWCFSITIFTHSPLAHDYDDFGYHGPRLNGSALYLEARLSQVVAVNLLDNPFLQVIILYLFLISVLVYICCVHILEKRGLLLTNFYHVLISIAEFMANIS